MDRLTGSYNLLADMIEIKNSERDPARREVLSDAIDTLLARAQEREREACRLRLEAIKEGKY